MNATRELIKSSGKVSVKKFSALLALRKAILDERYEDCAKLVASAYLSQASQSEVSKVLYNPNFHLEGL